VNLPAVRQPRTDSKCLCELESPLQHFTFASLGCPWLQDFELSNQMEGKGDAPKSRARLHKVDAYLFLFRSTG